MPASYPVSTRSQTEFALEDEAIGQAIYTLASEIFPFCRSITGNGSRKTLASVGRHFELEVREVPTGTPVYDWTVPREWNIRDAWIKDPAGRRIVDFATSNLHVVGYSVPIDRQMTLAELRPHLHAEPKRPHAIPFRSMPWHEGWGFCLPQALLDRLSDGVYDVQIDSKLSEGFLTYGEFLHRGATEEEVLLSVRICHPSLANDNCSALALLTTLAARISRLRTRLSYRFLFLPGTLGALAWLSRNETILPRIRSGLVVSCVGDSGRPTYKMSRRGDALIDRAMRHVLTLDAYEGEGARIESFTPDGHDERQFCSPGFDLAVGHFQRSPAGRYPQAFTSDDDLSLIAPQYLGHSFNLIVRALAILERDRTLVNVVPKGEPHLARRGFSTSGTGPGSNNDNGDERAMLWVLNFSDGRNSLLDIAERSGLPFADLHEAALDLEESGLVLTLAAPPPGRLR